MISLGIDIGGTTVKAAALLNDEIAWTARSKPYSAPDRPALLEAVRQATARLAAPPDRVGLCVPGLLDERRQNVTYSANIPSLNNLPLSEFIQEATARSFERLAIANDANATAFDIFATRNLVGRLLVLAMGAGVGTSVLDDGKPLYVEGDSAGHLGQMDISLEGEPIVGPDGGRGGAEGYVGAAALAARYGVDPASKILVGDLPFRAIVRLIRVAHALYRPHHVCLAGGTGIRLSHLLPELRKSVEAQLTSLARPGWTLFCGDSDFHAAMGAARIAARDTGF